MKYLLTLASAMVVFASSANACPFKDKQHASGPEQTPILASQHQSESGEVELTDSELLLLLNKKPKVERISYN